MCCPVYHICLISIHAPREGSDQAAGTFVGNNAVFQSTLPVRGATLVYSDFSQVAKFQSTLPVRGATPLSVAVLGPYSISIHAPREGSDVL